MTQPPRDDDRRDFLQASLRWLALGSLSLLGWRLLRGDMARRAREICLNRGVCRGCAAYRDCGLPAALSAKRRRGEPLPTEKGAPRG